ncbi:MAG TPA: hypothetical protein VII92_08545, partial [Anaerolineae bacterium]
SVKITIAGALIPVTQEIVEGVKGWILENRDLVDTKIQEFIDQAVNAGRRLAPVIQDLAIAFGEMLPVLLDTVGEIASFVGQIKELDQALSESSIPNWQEFKDLIADSITPFETIGNVIDAVATSVVYLSDKLGDMLAVLSPALAGIAMIPGISGIADTGSVSKRGLAGVETVDYKVQNKYEHRSRGVGLKGVSDAGLQAIAMDTSLSLSDRQRAADKLHKSKADAAYMDSYLAAGESAVDSAAVDAFFAANEAGTFAGRAKTKRPRKRGGGRARKAVEAEAAKDEALTDAELLQLVNQAAQSGQSLTGLIGDRKIPGGVPPVITVTINKFDQAVTIAANVTVNGVPGTSAEQVASVAVSQFRDELGKAIAEAKEDLAPVQAI